MSRNAGDSFMHFILIVLVLFIFTKLSIDAIILGALALLFYQSAKPKRKRV